MEMIRKARALIAKPGSWCQGANARTADGRRVLAGAPDAVQFCAHGSLAKVYQEAYRALKDHPEWGRSFRALADTFDEAKWAVVQAAHKLFGIGKRTGIMTFNDLPERTHGEVLAAFDEAIEEAAS